VRVERQVGRLRGIALWCCSRTVQWAGSSRPPRLTDDLLGDPGDVARDFVERDGAGETFEFVVAQTAGFDSLFNGRSEQQPGRRVAVGCNAGS
jgi:hypothetical protein